MKQAISILVHIYNYVRDGLAIISGLLVVAMVLYVSASVFLRHTPYPMGWGLEVAEYSLIILTFFSAGWLLKNRGHTRIDILLDLIKSHVPGPSFLMELSTSRYGSHYLVSDDLWLSLSRGKIICRGPFRSKSIPSPNGCCVLSSPSVFFSLSLNL